VCDTPEVSSDTPTVAGRLIRAARRDAEISQGALGERIGVRQQTVAKWESGENRPTMDNLVAIAAALPAFDLYGAVEALWPTVAEAAARGVAGRRGSQVARPTNEPEPERP
jgi:transcriptional regulator with XRE-family HTH domain